MSLIHVDAIRYVAPLREGGSLPAIVDASDGATYVVKFRGAGQGARALVAEVIVAKLALALGLPVPRPAIVTVDEGFGRSEPDPEIQDVLRGSIGDNFGLAYLPGAFGFDSAVDSGISPDLAAAIVWFDSLVLNVDRTPRNPNILIWKASPWLIDHGAALYFHHGWRNWRDRGQDPFTRVEDHVLLAMAGDPRDADATLRASLDDTTVRQAIASVPEAWLEPANELESADEQRDAYFTWLSERLNGPRAWLETATDAWHRGPGSIPGVSHTVWYSYAIVRVVPRVERGEFCNVGVIMFAPEAAYLAARIELNQNQIEVSLCGLAVAELQSRLDALVGVAAGDPAHGLMAAMPLSERYHWLTAPRSTVIQTSPPHTGRTDDPALELERLMDVFVRSAPID